MEITAFDWTVITVVGLSGLLALFRGFVREVLSLAAWIAAVLTTIHFMGPAAEMLKPHVPTKIIATGGAAFGIFFGVLILCAIINSMIIRFLNDGSDIGLMDSVLGMVFGIARGMFILAIAYLMITVVLPKGEFPDWMKNARTRPYVEASAQLLARMAPGYVNNLSELSKQAKDQGEQAAKEKLKKELDEELQKKNSTTDTGYNEDKRKELERLLNNLEQENVSERPGETNQKIIRP